MRFESKDIVAIKNIDGHSEHMVYLGALQPAKHRHIDPGTGCLSKDEGPNPGVWCRFQDAALCTPSSFHDGRVGDLLAVSATSRCSFVSSELFGRLVALRQHGKVTHLVVVRSAANLDTPWSNPKPNSSLLYHHFLWVQVLGICESGFTLPAPYDGSGFSFNLSGGNYNRIDEQDFVSNGGSAQGLRFAIWSGFSALHAPGPEIDCRRGAIRP